MSVLMSTLVSTEDAFASTSTRFYETLQFLMQGAETNKRISFKNVPKYKID